MDVVFGVVPAGHSCKQRIKEGSHVILMTENSLVSRSDGVVDHPCIPGMEDLSTIEIDIPMLPATPERLRKIADAMEQFGLPEYVEPRMAVSADGRVGLCILHHSGLLPPEIMNA